MEGPLNESRDGLSVEVESGGLVNVSVPDLQLGPGEIVDELDATQREVLGCLYTRHSNGYTEVVSDGISF
jgi:hypothetical protein